MSIRSHFYIFAVILFSLVACSSIASPASGSVNLASSPIKVSDVPDYEINETVEPGTEDSDSVNDTEEQLATSTEELLVENKTYDIFKKDGFIAPDLIRTGHPNKESKSVKKIEIKGKIFPERHPLGHRRYFYRWVLEKADGDRIPLKSNLTLLQKVKNEDLLDGFVSVKGVWLVSPSNKNLKFFKVATIRVINELTDKTSEDKAEPKILDESTEVENQINKSDSESDDTESKKSK